MAYCPGTCTSTYNGVTIHTVYHPSLMMGGKIAAEDSSDLHFLAAKFTGRSESLWVKIISAALCQNR